jgi:hypothetical protein
LLRRELEGVKQKTLTRTTAKIHDLYQGAQLGFTKPGINDEEGIVCQL